MIKTNRQEIVRSLKRQLEKFSGTPPPREPAVISTGIAELDDMLPRQGIPQGGIVEWLTAGQGLGAATLALAGVRAALARGGWWVVLDQQGDFFPPAVVGWQVSLERLLVVRPTTPQDAAWAFEQVLRCTGVAVAWHWVGNVSEKILHRWKVAAEAGHGQGVLFRSLHSRGNASWADVRWQVEPIPKRAGGRSLQVEMVYCRDGGGHRRLNLECDDETGAVCLASAMADSTSRSRTA